MNSTNYVGTSVANDSSPGLNESDVRHVVTTLTMGMMWTTVWPNARFAAAGALALFAGRLPYLLCFRNRPRVVAQT